jgi:hypothetical protein
MIEGYSGCDGSLIATPADVALARALAQSSVVSSNLAFATAATPAGLTAPSAVVLAATLFTPMGTSVALVTFDLFYTDSAADTVSVAVSLVPNATAIAGGAPPTIGEGFLVENGGTAVSVTGGSPITVGTYSKANSTGPIATSLSFNLYLTMPTSTIGEMYGVVFKISAAHNLSAMTLNTSVSQP